MKQKKISAKPKKLVVTCPVMRETRPKKSSYDTDFYKWSYDQAELLREKDFDHIDWENVIEEIESLGRSDKRALRSHLRVLLMHMLKMEYQPHGMGNSFSWRQSISNARAEIKVLTNESPSLKKMIPELILETYELAKNEACSETGIPVEVFPRECPWSQKEIFLS